MNGKNSKFSWQIFFFYFSHLCSCCCLLWNFLQAFIHCEYMLTFCCCCLFLWFFIVYLHQVKKKIRHTLMKERTKQYNTESIYSKIHRFIQFRHTWFCITTGGKRERERERERERREKKKKKKPSKLNVDIYSLHLVEGIGVRCVAHSGYKVILK